jgi:ubiquinone/menaquinone biosynthesis C-methylase UbiE
MAVERHDFLFKVMSLEFKIRDLFSPRVNLIADIGLKAGDKVLDFGCGPGAYVPAVEDLVGPAGYIYALDAQPLAVQTVQDLSRKKKLANITTILSDRATGLPGNSIDIILLYDILHGLETPGLIMEELYRVLKPQGILSVNDHHLEGSEIIERVTSSGLFNLKQALPRSHNFQKS